MVSQLAKAHSERYTQWKEQFTSVTYNSVTEMITAWKTLGYQGVLTEFKFTSARDSHTQRFRVNKHSTLLPERHVFVGNHTADLDHLV